MMEEMTEEKAREILASKNIKDLPLVVTGPLKKFHDACVASGYIERLEQDKQALKNRDERIKMLEEFIKTRVCMCHKYRGKCERCKTLKSQPAPQGKEKT
jgi:uncharacterized protein with von Willebrand factor type A (vWA) domain